MNDTHAFFLPPFFPFEILLFLLHKTQKKKKNTKESANASTLGEEINNFKDCEVSFTRLPLL